MSPIFVKGGSMHVFTHTIFGGHGIVGAQILIGAGIAFAQKYLGERNATFSLYGDGGAGVGGFQYGEFRVVLKLMTIGLSEF
jgi:TPP-dependent pyruvate/acetoin dehydrogenase alpha subunit